jgi:NtrC-family two-component system sensor histidine kinase KinB
VTIGLAVCLSAILAWALASSLLMPIKALTASATALGEGDLDIEVPEFSRDELGSLARSFNAMAAHLRSYREATVARVLRTQRTMEATLTTALEPLFVVSSSGLIEIRNPAAEELSKGPDFEAGLPENLAAPLALVLEKGEHYLPTDYSRVVTFRLGREDRHYLPRILAIGDKLTEFKGAAVILQDVTKFRLLDDVKTNLVGTVSHELKTPLTSLRMAVYLLLEKTLGPLSPGQTEMLESARDDADRLLRILDSLLDLTRLEAGASALERSPVSVEELLTAISDEARTFITLAGQKLEVHHEPGLGEISVDATTAAPRVHQPPLQRLEVFTRRRKHCPLGGRGAPGIRPLQCPGPWERNPSGGGAAALRPVLQGPRPVQAGCGHRPCDRARNRGRARGQHIVHSRRGRRHRVLFPDPYG